MYVRAPSIGPASQQVEQQIKAVGETFYGAASPRLIFSSQYMHSYLVPKRMGYLPINEVWSFMNTCATVVVVVVVVLVRGVA